MPGETPDTQPLPAAACDDALSVRTVDLRSVARWLGRGAADLRRCPVPGLLHGLVAAVFGAVLLWLARDRFWLLAGAFSGFLLVAPLLATGLYAVSRALESGRCVGTAEALATWRPNNRRMVAFGLLLALAGTGWVLTSAALITVSAPLPIRSPADFLRTVVLGRESMLFEGWLLLGGVMAAPIFASSVVALPLLMDRRVGVAGAVLTSWRVVLANPLPMAAWALCLALLSLLAITSALVGLIVVVPWLAHASWHAYRDLVGSPR